MSCPKCGAEEGTARCPNYDIEFEIPEPEVVIVTTPSRMPQVQVQSGWYCPKCGMVNAPWMNQCPCNISPMMYFTYVGD